jgi:dTDP-4-dehydrorhamnose 3,5-epimerase
MNIRRTSLEGVLIVEPKVTPDARGLFARTYDAALFAKAGMPTDWPQHNVSWNRERGTLRGMHFQAEPHPEPKLVRCLRGRIYDVAIDLRSGSPTFKRWFAVELFADRRNALFIPAGLAHGFLTLENGCEVSYLMGDSYDAALARGVRWNDPAFAIEWPFEPIQMSERDAAFPDFGS